MEVFGMGNAKTETNGVITIDVYDQECTVAPMELIAGVGDPVSFENLSQGRAIVFFPSSDIFGQHTYEIDTGGKISVTVGSVEPGSYPFTVFCEHVEGFSDKAARPRIIVLRDVS